MSRSNPASRAALLMTLSSQLLAVLIIPALTQSAAAFQPVDRWMLTSSGATGPQGFAITLTWSIVPDGTTIPNEGPSDLIAHLDRLYGVSVVDDDLTKRPWFPHFERSFNRWSELGGITFQYQPNDDGAVMQSARGIEGLRGDVRIGGAYIDGENGLPGFTWLPESGDIVVDTGESSVLTNPLNDFRGFRNLIMHELGHSIGLLHIESSTDSFLMEPAVDPGIDGPQLDDIRGLHSLYGDKYEKTNTGRGNGTASLATYLGEIDVGTQIAVGVGSASGQFIHPDETDFVSISNQSDIDFYAFSIVEPSLLNAQLIPLGGTFRQGIEGSLQAIFDANSRSDLSLAIFARNGTTELASVNRVGAGNVEYLSQVSLLVPDTYYVRVTGSSTSVQLYQLEMTAIRVPEPVAARHLACATVLCLLYSSRSFRVANCTPRSGPSPALRSRCRAWRCRAWA